MEKNQHKLWFILNLNIVLNVNILKIIAHKFLSRKLVQFVSLFRKCILFIYFEGYWRISDFAYLNTQELRLRKERIGKRKRRNMGTKEKNLV